MYAPTRTRLRLAKLRLNRTTQYIPSCHPTQMPSAFDFAKSELLKFD